MHGHDASSLVILLALGVAHGVNPAMGWLFAVSLGLQEQRRGAVWRAFAPLAVGHCLAIAAALAAAIALGVVVPIGILKWLVATALVGMGALQLRRHWHPRWGGMRVTGRDLVIWSFLMASAHGAGLMALPFLLPPSDVAAAHAATGHAGHATAGAGAGMVPASAAVEVDLVGLLGPAIHTIGYLVTAALIAVLVYEKLGLRLLRRAWININLIWAAALIVTGMLTPLL